MWKHQTPIPAPGPPPKTHRSRPGPGHSRTELPRGTPTTGKGIPDPSPGTSRDSFSLHPGPPGSVTPGPGGRFQISTLPGTNGQTPPGKTGEITRRLTAGQRRTASLNTAPSSPVGSVTAQPASPRSVQNSSRGKFQFCTKTCLRVKPQDNPIFKGFLGRGPAEIPGTPPLRRLWKSRRGGKAEDQAE